MINNLAVSLSILVNAILGGMRYEMLSSGCYRCGWWFTASLIDWWFEVVFDDDDHCQECYDKQRDKGIYDI